MATKQYTVNVADVMRVDPDGTPERKLTIPSARMTVRDIAGVIARGAAVTCCTCGQAWDWCPELRDGLERALPRARAAYTRSAAAAGMTPLPVWRTRDDGHGLRHAEGLVVIA